MDTYEDENEAFIRANIPALLETPEVKAKTNEIGGEWRLHEIPTISPRPKNIGFTAGFENGQEYLKIHAKINRDTSRFSNIEIDEI